MLIWGFFYIFWAASDVHRTHPFCLPAVASTCIRARYRLVNLPVSRIPQRRVQQWPAPHGPDKGVMFLQEHRAGVLGISDFTLLKGAPITVA